MGSVCCVAAKDRNIQRSIGAETFHSNSIYSWGVQGNRQGHSMSEINGGLHEIPSCIVRHRNMNMKGNFCFEAGDCSGGERNLENATLHSSQDSPTDEIDTSTTVHNFAKSTDREKSRTTPTRNLSFSLPCTPTLTIPTTDLSRPPSRSTPHRRTLLSPATNSISEGSRSLVPSNRSDASSDGWSMRTFTELVASSQRERWSFESEASIPHILPSPSPSSSATAESRTCAACTKPLSATLSWSDSEMCVAAVLVCGHVYHATCLENMTPETGKYDPPCPLCTIGEKQVIKMSKRAQRKEADFWSKNGRISRNRVVDSFLGSGTGMGTGDARLDRQASSSRGSAGKKTKFDLSFSGRRASFVKPFLRRNFSLESSNPRHPQTVDAVPRKGFWSRSRPHD